MDGGGSDQELSQAAPYAHICYRNPTPQLPPSPITANQHHQPTTSDTHQSQPPLMPPITSFCHCTTHHGGWQWGCRQWGASVVSGSDGSKVKKTSCLFFCFFPQLGGRWVGQKQVLNFPNFFGTLH